MTSIKKGFLKFKQGRFKLQDFGLFEKKIPLRTTKTTPTITGRTSTTTKTVLMLGAAGGVGWAAGGAACVDGGSGKI